MLTYDINSVVQYFNKHEAYFLTRLKDLVRIPSISFPNFAAAPVRECAESVVAILKDCGLTDVHLLETGVGHPSVFGQWNGAPGKPTLLLYAHYDVQPTGRTELWFAPPFDPVERNGRLYGRGTSDDKAGVLMYAVAVRCYLESMRALPINVKILIEGEEEVGSTNLGKILAQNIDLLSADAVLIADSENFDSGTPTLTASLRGIVTVSVEVRSLSSSVHSGTWGGPLPDPVIALSKIIASLVDDDGRPAISGLSDSVRMLSPSDKSKLNSLPFDEKHYRKQAKLLKDVRIIGGDETVYEKMWYRPSIAVNAFEASSRKQAANIINDVAWARIGIRIVPNMDTAVVLDLLTEHLRARAPWGVQLTIKPETPAQWWETDSAGPIFEAALRSLKKGYDNKPMVVGAGGSIPFVETITEALGGIPALLFGVGDPYSAAHSENESLLITDWVKGCRSIIYLFTEIAAMNG